MKAIALLVPCLLSTSCCPPPGARARRLAAEAAQAGLPADPSDLLGIADAIFDGFANDPRCLGRGIAAVERAMALRSRAPRTVTAPFDSHWRMAKGYYLLGELLSREEQLALSRKGEAAARKAIAAAPHRVEGHYYLAVHLGKRAEISGDVTLIRPGVAAAEAAARIDPSFDLAGPLVFLGKVFITAPPWPMSVGNPEKAIRLLERALRIAPRPLTRVFLGQAYYEEEQYERAAQLLKAALRDAHLLAPRWRREAENCLRRIREESALHPCAGACRLVTQRATLGR